MKLGGGEVPMISEEKLKSLPALPGVYLMKGKKGEVLYIGKAKSIRSRVRTYFHGSSDTRYTVRFLVAKVASLDYIVTANEKEAFILEDTLLKRYKPRYNIRLKDDKSYVNVKLTLGDAFPRILVTRKVKKDGGRYFGPYASAHKVRETVKFIRRLFPLCVCSASEFNNRVRPCIDYQLGICAAPCVGYISEESYGELLDGAALFLEGRNRRLMTLLKGKMKEAAGRMEFEAAAAIRDRIAALEETLREQKVVSHTGADRDFFAWAEEEGALFMKVLSVREGRVVGGRDFSFKKREIPLDEFLAAFLSQYYRREFFVPDEVVVPRLLEERQVIEGWLSESKGKKVRIVVPRRGERVRLLAMAADNAAEALRERSAGGEERAELLPEALRKRLRLKTLPRVIEAFDISNTSGKLAVGAMVTFSDGAPDKKRYRLFRVRRSDGPDDYGMMYEVMSRRYKRSGGDGWALPDLIIVDGGKGQLNVALKVLQELGIEGVEVGALAKERKNSADEKKGRGERFFLPLVKDPVVLREGSKPDLLLRRIRDEVHRFAISYHKRLRKQGIASVLDDIDGIGPARRKALLTRFGDIGNIKAASKKELLTVEGINEKIAVALREGLASLP